MANGKVDLTWADGDYPFNIAKIGQTLELEEKCDAGVAEIFTRLREGRWRFNDARETIRLGLIGGGMKPTEALVLTRRYVDDRPWQESVPIATMILMAAMVGVPGDEVGKGPADRATNEAGSSTKTGALSDPPSTESAPASASLPDKSTNARFGKSQPASTATTPLKERSPTPTP